MFMLRRRILGLVQVEFKEQCALGAISTDTLELKKRQVYGDLGPRAPKPCQRQVDTKSDSAAVAVKVEAVKVEPKREDAHQAVGPVAALTRPPPPPLPPPPPPPPAEQAAQTMETELEAGEAVEEDELKVFGEFEQLPGPPPPPPPPAAPQQPAQWWEVRTIHPRAPAVSVLGVGDAGVHVNQLVLDPPRPGGSSCRWS